VFIGHSALAFALAAWLARATGADRPAAVTLGSVAAAVAVLPDVDLSYGIVRAAVVTAAGSPPSWEAFWGVSNGLHRGVTHPLPLALATVPGFALGTVLARRSETEWSASPTAVAGALLVPAVLGVGGVVRAGVARGGTAGGVVGALFGVAVAAAGGVAAARTDRGGAALTAAAAVGIGGHPFGDVFMAAPPPLFAPLAGPVLDGRVALAADPTVALLCVLGVEVAVVWAALWTYGRLTGRSLAAAVAPTAALGAGYALAAVALPRPTMANAHVLGFTAVPLAALVGAATLRRDRGIDAAFRAATTGTATLTVAAVAYLLVYRLGGVA